MGQNMTVSKYKPPKGEEINRNNFEFLYIIGKGGFGKVWKVIYKKTKAIYALKEMQKVKVIDKRSEKAIKYERELLSQMSHSFLVNMYYSFQDADYLYLVMDLLIGGDLRYHISRHRIFSEEQTSIPYILFIVSFHLEFFVVCIILALEYIHSKNIIHRDIKPENFVLDEKGYVCLTDFGIAKLYSNRNSNETSGTPGYMSPEVMNGKDHSFPVDYFALGVMGYEFMLGRRPYLGKSRKEIKEKMMAKQAVIKDNEIPQGWNKQAADFVNKLLIRKAEGRLGAKGIKELKEHPWVKDYNWTALAEKKISTPFIPAKRDNFDKRYCEAIDKNGYETQHRYEKIRNIPGFQNSFLNYTYYKILNCEDKEVSSVAPCSSTLTTTYNPYLKPKNNMTAFSSNPFHFNRKLQSNVQSNSINIKQIQDNLFNSKQNVLTAKKDNCNSSRHIPKSNHSQLNLIKKSSTIVPKSPINRDKDKVTDNSTTTIQKSLSHKMSLSPMHSYKSFNNNQINSSLSSSNILKPELTNNTKLNQTSKNSKDGFNLNIIKQIQSQKRLASKQFKRSNSTIINSMLIKPSKSDDKKTMVASVDLYDRRQSSNKSVLLYSQSYNKKANQIIIDNSIDIQQMKNINCNKNNSNSNSNNKKNAGHSDSINLLFKHYKMSSVSSNSTGSSLGNNNNSKSHLVNK